MRFGFDLNAHPLAGDEIRAWAAPPVVANTRDRSLLGSLNRYRFEAWHHFAYANRSLPEAAASFWDGLFRHPSLAAPGKRYGYDAWHRPLELVQARLQTGKTTRATAVDVSTGPRVLH